ncbi:SHOCT domain-containing protein [Microbacterium candidum]|uniref:SHOCT domain-containing protein n=1 Tax=Microbacterium candidum TaxID=3041922 RepID=A0ABT7N2A8_9MICO|nr:SHOCT domain-containing protein [Microbacterium sp. ASV49]MDL9980854.1 SHOCT domain-containing protein [Microbacterium sp. ASV49]
MHADDTFSPPVDQVNDPVVTTFGGMGFLMILFMLLFAAMVVFVVVVAIRKWAVLRGAGIDPLTVDAQIAAKLVNSDVLKGAPAPTSVEERLARLDDLERRGVITADERATARADILRG